jgi:hypothetical protein
VELEHGGSIELHKHAYSSSFFRKGFWGGNAPYSEWLEENSLLASIQNAGWRVVDQRDDSGVNGPAKSFILAPQS